MLTDHDHAVLAFERQWWKYSAAKDQAIRDQFGLTPVRYYQQLQALIQTPEAEAVDAALVRRLRRLRDARQHQRTARRLQVRA